MTFVPDLAARSDLGSGRGSGLGSGSDSDPGSDPDSGPDPDSVLVKGSAWRLCLVQSMLPAPYPLLR